MRTGQVIDALPSFDADGPLRSSLSNYDTGSGTLHLDGASPDWVRALKPGASWLACYDDDHPSHPIQWVGYTTSWQRSAGSDDVQVTLSTAGGYLDRVFVPDRSYPASDWGRNQIIADLISGLVVEQPIRRGIPLLLDYSGNGPTPTTDYVWQNTDNVTVLGRIQTLLAELGGEWFIDWDWAAGESMLVPTFRFADKLGAASPGPQSNVAFEFPGALIDLAETLDYTDGKGSNAVTAYSTPSGSSTVVPVADPVVDNDPDRPVFDFRYQPAPGLTVQQCLSFAQLAIGILGPGSKAYELSVSTDQLDTRRYGVDYGIGDNIDVIVHATDRAGQPVPAFPSGLVITGRVIAYEITSDAVVTPVLEQAAIFSTDDEDTRPPS